MDFFNKLISKQPAQQTALHQSPAPRHMEQYSPQQTHTETMERTPNGAEQAHQYTDTHPHPAANQDAAPAAEDSKEMLLYSVQPSSKKTIELNSQSPTLNELLIKMSELNASDLHFEVGSPPTYRIRGEIVFTNAPEITQDFAERTLYAIINEEKKKKFASTGNVDFCYDKLGQERYRVNYLRHRKGIGGVFRIIPSRIPTMEELNMPEAIKSIAMSRRGIVLVTGPTGSGKTTTMASMINYINNNKQAHIITIEDPIEFAHTPLKSLISHREIGLHAKSFSSALKAALREDPDVILVGELRDLETISLALTAAQMGVLVMGTLHTNSATKTIDRMIDVFPAKQQEQARIQLSQSLRAIIAQQLLKTADGSGRIAALEILISEHGLANMIREGKTTQIPTYIIMGKSKGMQYMDNELVELVKKGRITKAEALLRARDLKVFERAGML